MFKKICLFLAICFSFSGTQVFAAENNLNLFYNEDSIELNLNRNGSGAVEYVYEYHSSKGLTGAWSQDYFDFENDVINIKTATDEKIVFDFVRGGDVLYDNIEVEMKNNAGTFSDSSRDIKGDFRITKKASAEIYLYSKKTSIFGLHAKVSAENLSLEDCTAAPNYDFYQNNDIILFESDSGSKNSLIGVCHFFRFSDDNAEVKLESVTLSTDAGFQENNSLAIDNQNSIKATTYESLIYDDTFVDDEEEAMEEGDNNEAIKIALTVFITIGVAVVGGIGLSYFIKDKNGLRFLQKYFILGLVLLPFALDAHATVSEVNAIRSYLLNYTTSKNGLKDFDSDRRITINDLILAKINSLTPEISFVNENIKIDDDYKYATYVELGVYIDSSAKITELSFCTTSNASCTPTTNILEEMDDTNHAYFELPSDVAPQRVCVRAKNDRGFSFTKCGDTEYLVDTLTPNISVKQSPVRVSDFSEYTQYENNLSIEYGPSGSADFGCYETNGTEKEKTISCVAVGNNGLETTAEYKIIIEDSPIADNPQQPENPGPNPQPSDPEPGAPEPEAPDPLKTTILFLGDSITSGLGSLTGAWAEKLTKTYGISTINRGVPSIKLACSRDSNGALNRSDQGCLFNYIRKGTTPSIKPDIVILSGGINDSRLGVPGMSSSDNLSKQVNRSVEDLKAFINQAKTQWPDAKFGFIQTYDNSSCDGEAIAKWGADYTTRLASFYTGIRSAVSAAKIPIFNLSGNHISPTTGKSVSMTTLLASNNKAAHCSSGSKYFRDDVHINDAGYNVTLEYLYYWINDKIMEL